MSNGSIVIKARMPADQGEVVLKALDVAETFLNNSDNNGSTADRYQVVFHVRGGSDVGSMPAANIEHGPDVSAVTSQRIACDCSTVQLTECDHGEQLSVGRKTRVIPSAIRRALQARDGGFCG
ncbi:MAG: hypothetical protein KJP08_03765 [Gammaproteobacteria bacterium]|nr:hypothetical protein [Gammaproteobacteria bacterium]NNF48290.1 hypothetical protein [Woeseiaceae bacterium]MBT8093904.1 hypothetical protein [Gammaproteobacteria bacterium]MBT8105480.1 hypothetical protein [Gammaproteobacteria bacterium]NNK25494.1 hypothetical protein [Woeseiaceae bacterium]